MTRTIVAILALSPAILFAQATTPAQPASTPVLQSALVRPAGFAELSSADPKAAPTPVRLTTGVIPPTLITNVEAPVDPRPAVLHLSHTVVLDLTVDATGKPTDIKVVESANKFVDQDAVTAISKYRFKPASLDGQPTAVPMRLRYVVRTSASM